ncbi:MAG: hypothetical protein IJ011_02275 [Clostridia bacterium]|nr:hypothetical protein [Clostridia bacterium]
MKLFRFILIIALCLSLCSCGGERPTGDILSELMEACPSLPEGVIYSKGTIEGEEGYLSDTLAEALYGEDAAECFALVEDYSIYISSFATPYEIAVLRCYSSTDAIRIEQLCRARADIVSVALRHTEFYALCQNIRVLREGETVVFLMTDDPDGNERLARRLI